MIHYRLTPFIFILVSLLNSTHTDVIIFDDSMSFDNLVLQAKKPTVVKFFTPWCSHCIVMARANVFANVSNISSFKDTILFVEIDAYKYHDISTKYNINTVPNFLFFNQGAAIAEHKGALSHDALRTKLVSIFSIQG